MVTYIKEHNITILGNIVFYECYIPIHRYKKIVVPKIPAGGGVGGVG